MALLYTAPVFSLGFSAVLLKEHITKKAGMLALLAVVGVGRTKLSENASFNWGVLAGLMAGVCYSLYGVLGNEQWATPTRLLWSFYLSIF